MQKQPPPDCTAIVVSAVWTTLDRAVRVGRPQRSNRAGRTQATAHPAWPDEVRAIISAERQLCLSIVAPQYGPSRGSTIREVGSVMMFPDSKQRKTQVKTDHEAGHDRARKQQQNHLTTIFLLHQTTALVPWRLAEYRDMLACRMWSCGTRARARGGRTLELMPPTRR